MWVPKAITDGENSSGAFAAKVISAQSNNVVVSGLEQVKSIDVCLPYGIVSVPPQGEKVIMLPVGSTAVMCGVCSNAQFSLESGEIGLYSAGGASIVLKNDGSVVINGHVFSGDSE